MDCSSTSMANCHIWNGWEQCFDPPNAVLRVSSIANFEQAQCSRLVSGSSRDGTKGMMLGA